MSLTYYHNAHAKCDFEENLSKFERCNMEEHMEKNMSPTNDELVFMVQSLTS